MTNYYNLLYKNKNFIVLPKCGCTHIIKLTTITDEFKSHNHSFNHNNCDKYDKIHKCGRKLSNKNRNNLETIVIFRYPHERIISFYNGNLSDKIRENLSFSDFLNKYLNDNYDKFGAKHHLFEYNKCDIESKYKSIKFLHTNNINKYWNNVLGINIDNYNIINKSIKFENISKEQINIIKNKLSKEYNYLNNRNIINFN